MVGRFYPRAPIASAHLGSKHSQLSTHKPFDQPQYSTANRIAVNSFGQRQMHAECAYAVQLFVRVLGFIWVLVWSRQAAGEPAVAQQVHEEDVQASSSSSSSTPLQVDQQCPISTAQAETIVHTWQVSWQPCDVHLARTLSTKACYKFLMPM